MTKWRGEVMKTGIIAKKNEGVFLLLDLKCRPADCRVRLSRFHDDIDPS